MIKLSQHHSNEIQMKIAMIFLVFGAVENGAIGLVGLLMHRGAPIPGSFWFSPVVDIAFVVLAPLLLLLAFGIWRKSYPLWVFGFLLIWLAFIVVSVFEFVPGYIKVDPGLPPPFRPVSVFAVGNAVVIAVWTYWWYTRKSYFIQAQQ